MVPRTFSIRKVRTHARLPDSSFTHSDNTAFKHGGGITAPEFESILRTGLIIAVVLDNGKRSGLRDSSAANTKILDSDALLLF